jgi:dephospho-CoA kinase
VLSADGIAKELCESDPGVRRKLLSLLGPEAYTADGRYNRPSVAARIFQEPALRSAVEAVIHPKTEREIASRARALRRDGHRIVLVEAALVYEARMDEWLHGVLFVDADESVRRERLLRTRAFSEEEIRRRMAAQGPQAAFAKRAEYVIKNNGTLDELRDRAGFFAALFRSLALTTSP